jgi:O-antigen/teichoic acid export membrane protein
MVDQLLASGSNFVLAIVLARWLEVNEYGAYAVSFAVFLLLATIYQGVLLVPFSVLAMTTYKDRPSQYLGALIRIHVFITAMAAVLLWLASVFTEWLLPDSHLAGSLAGLAIAVPGVLTYWLARAAWYTTLRPGPAALGAAGYAGLLLGMVAWLRYTQVLSSWSAFAAMAAAGFITGVILLARLKPEFRASGETPGMPAREAWQEGWALGRWELAVAAAQWLPMNLCYPLSAGILGTGQTAALRALQNLAQPVNHAVTAVLRLATPYICGRFGEQGTAALPSVYLLTAATMGTTSLYVLVVSWFAEPLVALVYGGRFHAAAPLLPLILISTTLASGLESLAVGLRAARSSRRLFHAHLAAGFCYAITGVPAAIRWGLAGVVVTLALASAVGIVAAGILLGRATRDQMTDWEREFPREVKVKA